MARREWFDTPSTASPLSASLLNDLEDRKPERSVMDLNVKEPPFNAVGDGTTDDTAAIAAAFAAATSSNGRAVYIPAGTYRLTSSLTVPNTFRIYGDGRWASTLSMNANNTPILTSSVSASHSVTVEDIGLVYATQQTNASHPNGIAIGWSSAVAAGGQANVFYWTLRRLRIANATKGVGVLNIADSRAVIYVWNNHFEQILFQSISHTLIDTGDRSSPVDTFQMITHVGPPPSAQTGPALWLRGEFVVNGLDIEDWTGQLIDANGQFGQGGAIRGLHIERHTITQGSAQTLISLANGKYVIEDVTYLAFTNATAFAHILIGTSSCSLEYGNITVADWGTTGTLTLCTGSATDSHFCFGGINANQDSGVTVTGNAAALTQIEDAAITLGGDARLYRGAADRLQTPDNLWVDGTDVRVGQGTSNQIYLGASAVPSGTGIQFHTSGDVALGRATAKLLQLGSDNQLRVGTIAAASAANNSLFVDSADSKLKYKDGAGVTNALY